MLPIVNRLKKEKDFERVFKKGRSWKENFLYLKAANNSLKESRFGFAVSKKFSPKATVRNKIKRRLREIIKTNLPCLKKGADIVIIVLPGLEAGDFWELEEMVKRLLEKAGIVSK